ncbi:MAG: hypothetical protein IID30_05380 [Planctomycetes bacterium]|nr:hypothetical protein [Planctomycetota bacterium]MCH7601754.1 hypothetical protein [Planctomycetota bacterium]
MSNWKKTLALNVALMAMSSTLFSCSRKEHPATGHWLGSITDDSGRESWGTLLVEPDNAGSHTVALSYLSIGAFTTECVDFNLGESTIMFHYKKGKFDLIFEGELSEDGRMMSGTMSVPDGSTSALAGGTFSFEKTPRPIDLPTLMTFWGEIETPNGFTEITILLAETPDGRIVGEYNDPEHNLNHMPFYDVSRVDGVIHASISVFGPPMIFEITLSEDRKQLTGVLKGRGDETKLDLIRDE